MSLNLLLDNADRTIWQKWLNTGIFNGITTNPTLLRRASEGCNLENIKSLTHDAEQLGCKELHLQAWGATKESIKTCGLDLSKLSTSRLKIHVKIPITKNGCEAAKELINNNISITFTACYEVKQVLIAAAIGANYIAPYLGRINAEGRNGISEIIKMQRTLEGISSSCKILAASLRSTKEITYLASNGIKNFAINEKLALDIFESESTQLAADVFNKDYELNKN